MNTESKTEKLIILLTKETYDGNVEWNNEPVPSGLTQGTNDIFPLYLGTVYKDTYIGLFQRRYKHFHDEFEYSWSEEIGMCVLGDNEAILWEYKERSVTLVNLFEAAREQASGINSILDNLIN
mgnify:CR=1 FL=1